jgi:FAD/FMN-containing dehydrogenase
MERTRSGSGGEGWALIRWEQLERAIQGDLALAGSSAFRASRPVFNARFREVQPEAIVSCTTPQDVSEALSFGTRNALDIAVRSGGHSFAGSSVTRGLLVDVAPMRSVSVADDVATIGAGARLGEVYGALQDHDLAIPAGTCPDVGVAGLTLGGGLGILGRTYGVTSDRLLAAEIVLADGRVVTCDEHHEEDLFWALRGAGAGTFGVVTSLVLRTVPAPNVTNVHLVWSFDRAPEVVSAWQAWAPNGPDRLAASLKVNATGDVDRPPSVDVYGALLGARSNVARVFDELVARAGSDPVSSTIEEMSFPETRRFWAQLGEDEPRGDETEGAAEPVMLFAKSEFFRRPLPTEAIGQLLDAFSSDRAAGEDRELDFMPWGGAYNRVPSDATAFVHRGELFQLKHAVVLRPGASASAKEAAERQAARSWATVHPWGSGRVFQNFADPDLDDWASAYYGSNLERVLDVKSRYDPENVFGVGPSPRPR